MRNSALLVCLCVFVFGQLASGAQSSAPSSKKADENLPPIILSGLQAYKDKGPDEAVKAWIKGSPIDGSKEAMSQANNLRQVQDFYGAYKATEVICTREITSRTHIYYLTLDYEKGPLFAKFVIYRSDRGWILTMFKFNTQEELILPTWQLSK